jgi:hypothetical protein
VVAQTWNLDGDGFWNNSANWTGAFPNSNAVDAFFGNVITADRTITLGQNVTVRSVGFNSNFRYTFATGSELKIDTAGIGLTQSGSGGVTLNSTIRHQKTNTWTGNGTGVVTVNSAFISGAGVGLIKDGTFTLVLNGLNDLEAG